MHYLTLSIFFLVLISRTIKSKNVNPFLVRTSGFHLCRSTTKWSFFSFCNTFELLQQIYLVGLWYQQVDVNEASLGRIDSLIMPSHQYVYSLYCSICIFYDSYKENLFDNYVLLLLVIISFTLMILTFDSPLVVWEEIRS